MQTKDGLMMLPFALILQERLSYIGPEEFVQAFVQKDPLDNDKVMSGCFSKNKSPDKKIYTQLLCNLSDGNIVCRPNSSPSAAVFKCDGLVSLLDGY